MAIDAIAAPANKAPANRKAKATTTEMRLLRAFRFMPAEARLTMVLVAESYETEPPK